MILLHRTKLIIQKLLFKFAVVNDRIEVQVNNIKRREIVRDTTGQRGMPHAQLTGNIVMEFNVQVLSPVVKELADFLRGKSPHVAQQVTPKPCLCQFWSKSNSAALNTHLDNKDGKGISQPSHGLDAIYRIVTAGQKSHENQIIGQKSELPCYVVSMVKKHVTLLRLVLRSTTVWNQAWE